jgi:thioredoxin 1
MRSLQNNWHLLVALGLLVLVAGFSLGRPTACSTVPATPGPETRTVTETKGEEAMSTFAQTYGQVEYADQTNFDQLVLNSDVPVLVDFYADWCMPCRMVAPVLEELARETADARIVKVNVDESPQLAARYGISSIPSLLVFKDGQVADQHTGMASKAHLKALLSG